MTKSDQDHRANQLNPERDEYWQSRGYDERPDDWEDRLNDDDADAAPKETPQAPATQK